MTGIHGVVPQYPNRNVSALKTAPWSEVLGLLGMSGEEILIGLLLDCGVFVRVDGGTESFYQMSGWWLQSSSFIVCVDLLTALLRGATLGPGGLETATIRQRRQDPECQ
jgi:hypothetical protein